MTNGFGYFCHDKSNKRAPTIKLYMVGLRREKIGQTTFVNIQQLFFYLIQSQI